MGIRIWLKLPQSGLPAGDLYFDGNMYFRKDVKGMTACTSIYLDFPGGINSKPPSGKRKIYNFWVQEPATENRQTTLGFEYESEPEP